MSLTLQQKEAALAAHNARRDAEINDTTPEKWLSSLAATNKEESLLLTRYQEGAEVLNRYSINVGKGHQTIGAAENEAASLRESGCEIMIAQANGVNPYFVVAFKAK